MASQTAHSTGPVAGHPAASGPTASLERRRLQCYLALILADLAALFAGFLLIGYLYLGRDGIAQAGVLAQLLLPVFLTVALYNGSYSLSALMSTRNGGVRALAALGISAAAVVFIAFYTKSSGEFSRLVFTAGVFASALILGWMRLQMRAFVRWRCGENVVSEVVIDDGGPLLDLPGARHFDAAALGLSPSLTDPQALHRIGSVLASADRVIISCPPERRAAWAIILKGASIEGELVDQAVSDLGALGARIGHGQGLLKVSVGPLGLRARVMKRLFDIALAGTAAIVLMPLFLIVTLAILIEDGSPVLFVQRRVGRGNRFFDMYKFRSMSHALSDSDGKVSASREDKRITRVGAVIRRTSIDELPQIFNVLKGDMSNLPRSSSRPRCSSAMTVHPTPANSLAISCRKPRASLNSRNVTSTPTPVRPV